MLSKWVKRLSPLHRAKDKELTRATSRVALSIHRYKDVSQDIQQEIRNNGFAEFLIYDREGEDGHN
ncbi:hypothetical protein [Paenibacillus typhae]|uniref:Uncharacterized protein n=1 Tax=Paenibacillus typhae TaxID=1174501 RepID=A0A1G8QIU2_9BACL|nr:hypothetical protein [Paenibacillus typhae]SDJ04652.1 hypothetical protein SAMN05216192_11136 [Paenibacillus typhae]